MLASCLQGLPALHNSSYNVVKRARKACQHCITAHTAGSALDSPPAHAHTGSNKCMWNTVDEQRFALLNPHKMQMTPQDASVLHMHSNLT